MASQGKKERKRKREMAGDEDIDSHGESDPC